ncbi:MAG: acyl-CoA thioesterase/BAAT N-terminal domain-containing protein [Chlamydiae bacterium]|nr:acyl-CoA thioesterase/BAAT N-terminal domain-containing protein [Chlamydiota bacterium]
MSSFLFSCCLASTLLTQPQLSITQPSGKTIDQEVHIQVEKLKPFQDIELRAEAKDNKGDIWSSHATFRADSQGQVDVASTHPNENSSYEGVDETGLFWSMLPASGDTSSSFKCKNDAISVEIKLYASNELVTQKTVTRYLKTADVERIDVQENGLAGALFLPSSEKPLPVIITLSGSNGGLSENRAKLLASNGFAVFALGYFGVEGLPSNLQDIPLEYFKTAFSWLKEQPNIDSSHVGLYGASRGAELSLILGSFFPSSVQAIVAIVPSSVVYGGLSEMPVNAWIYQGKPILPFAPVPQTDFADGRGQTPENPANTRHSFLEGMKDKAAFAAASIPVENIRCPILLVSAGDDQMWPSDLYVQQIMDRLEKNHSCIVCRYLHYPEGGHGINIPNLPIPGPTYYHPVGKLWFSMGGTRSADARASSDAWNKLVAFFHESLDSANEIK